MEKIQTPQIAGWLLAPLAWLLLSLLSSTVTLVIYLKMLLSPESYHLISAQGIKVIMLWYFSLLCAIAMWSYTLWIAIAFFKRRQGIARHYIFWLLISILLALKTFAFSPISDEIALRQLLFSLLAASLFVPYFKRSNRVKHTFISP